MTIRMALKILAAMGVLAVMGFTGALAYHIVVRPLGGVFARIVPNPAVVAGKQPDADYAKMLVATELPDIDPGEKVFQKAHEMLALGDTAEARAKLDSIIVSYPSSASAPVARRIVGEMNLDEILSSARMDGKRLHVVKRGNSFFGIATEYRTTLDMILYLNGMMELKNLQPGEELIVMPLDFSLLVEPARKTVSIWDGDRFVCEYPILRLAVPGKLAPGKTKIASKLAEIGGRSVQPQSRDYRAATKILQLAKPAVQIRAAPAAGEPPHGIVLGAGDMEEICLLTRPGNTVEIR